MDIGTSLQKQRKNKKLTQEQLAQILNVSRQTISKWENNRGFPDIENLIWLCDIYEISLDELVSRDSIYYEKNIIIKKNKRKEFFDMFPKHTALTIIIFLSLCLLLIGHGVYSNKKELVSLEKEGFSKIYSVVEIELDESGKYKSFILENEEVISASQKNIEKYKLKSPVNVIKPNMTDPSTHSQLIFDAMLTD